MQFMADTLFLLLFTFFSNAILFDFLFFKYIWVYVTDFSSNEIRGMKMYV